MTQTWKFGGVDLSTFGAITLLNDPMEFVERRGGNITIPYRHGTVFTEKYFQSRSIAFGITINDASAMGMQAKFDDLRKLIAPRRQQTLEYTLEDSSVRTTQAVVEKALQVAHETILLARIVLEFELADPFFRSGTLIADNTTEINASPTEMIVTHPGTVEECAPDLILTGPLSNTIITNPVNGCVFRYASAIDAGDVVSVETNVYGEYLALLNGVTNVTRYLEHTGDVALMVLEPGENPLSITDDVATTGTVRVSFYPPYL